MVFLRDRFVGWNRGGYPSVSGLLWCCEPLVVWAAKGSELISASQNTVSASGIRQRLKAEIRGGSAVACELQQRDGLLVGGGPLALVKPGPRKVSLEPVLGA